MRRVQALSPMLRLGSTVRRVALIVLVVLAVVALLALLGEADLLKGALDSSEGKVKDVEGDGVNENGGIAKIDEAVTTLKGPATVTVGSVAGLGTLAGGAMMGLGMPQGIKLLGVSAGSMAAIVVAQAVIA